MTERPILFSSPMVRAILAGSKSQTRRVIKPQPVRIGDGWLLPMLLECPYGHPSYGSRLWVREAWKVSAMSHHTPTGGPEEAVYYVDYKADAGGPPHGKTVRFAEPVRNAWQKNRDGWRPSIHMPRWAARIVLEVTGVRVERVQDISEADAQAEGVEYEASEGVGVWKDYICGPGPGVWCNSARASFATLWDSINGKRYPLASNPWCWVLEFRRAG